MDEDGKHNAGQKYLNVQAGKKEAPKLFVMHFCIILLCVMQKCIMVDM